VWIKPFSKREDYSNMSGIDVDPTTDIMKSNENIGWNEEGDWVEYPISVSNAENMPYLCGVHHPIRIVI